MPGVVIKGSPPPAVVLPDEFVVEPAVVLPEPPPAADESPAPIPPTEEKP